MLQTIPISSFDTVAGLLISLGLIALGMLLFACLWMARVDYYLPARHRLVDRDSGDVACLQRYSAYWQYVCALLSLLVELDPTYWIREVGFEGRRIVIEDTGCLGTRERWYMDSLRMQC
jgi:hypothetical protein